MISNMTQTGKLMKKTSKRDIKEMYLCGYTKSKVKRNNESDPFWDKLRVDYE